MNLEAFIAAAHRREGLHPQAGHAASLEHGLRAGLRYLGDLGGKPAYPEPHHLLVLAYLAEPMNAKGWRVFDEAGYPLAVKVPALVELWCRRLPRWVSGRRLPRAADGAAVRSGQRSGGAAILPVAPAVGGCPVRC